MKHAERIPQRATPNTWVSGLTGEEAGPNPTERGSIKPSADFEKILAASIASTPERPLSSYSDAALNGVLLAIKYSFDPVAAQNLIRYFYRCFKEGHPINHRVLHEFVYHAFGRIVDGASADEAFGLKRGRGRPIEYNYDRDLLLCTCVTFLIKERKMSWEDAIAKTASRVFPEGKGEKAVQAAYSLYRDYIGPVDDEDRKELEAILDSEK